MVVSVINSLQLLGSVSYKMEQTHLLFLSALLVISVFFLVFKLLAPKSSTYPPGPYPLPIIGNFLHLCSNRPHIALANLANVHGSLMSLRLGSRLVIVGSNQVAATELLKINDQALSGRLPPETFIYLFGKAMELPTLLGARECTENWKMLRTLVKTELFPATILNSKAIPRQNKINELIDFLTTKKGKVVKIGELVSITVINTVSTLLFTKDLINIKDEGVVGGVQEHVRKLERLTSILNFGDYFPILSGFDVQGLGKKFGERIRRLAACWEDLVVERQVSKESNDACKGKDFLDVLLDRGFSKDQLDWFVSEIFVTSVDTTSNAVEWAMAELIKSQESMSKLREELVMELRGDIISDSDLPRLPYLNACVKETLRLRPSVPIIPRRAIETCRVMNYTIPGDADVWVNLWALGRDPTKWENPLAFKPNRFLESNFELRGNNYGYLPFGNGKRMCPGISFASRLVPLILASLVHSFDWELPDNMSPEELDMNELVGLTLKREKPLLLVPKSKDR